jgi:hypothetical protein
MQYRKAKLVTALMLVLITETTARADKTVIGIGRIVVHNLRRTIKQIQRLLNLVILDGRKGS